MFPSTTPRTALYEWPFYAGAGVLSFDWRVICARGPEPIGEFEIFIAKCLRVVFALIEFVGNED